MMVDIRTITASLAENIHSLVQQLFPAGRLVQQRYWRVGNLAGEAGQSLCIYLTGAKRGHWCDFASGERGDLLDLIAAVYCGDDLGAAIRWARNWLGLGRGVDPETARRLVKQAERRRVERQREARQAENSRCEALRILLEAKPLQRADFVDRYLLGRSVDLDTLPRLPCALRYHPHLYHCCGRYWPAMVAAISDHQGQVVAVHRTWLEGRNLACEDRPQVVKAPLGKEAKMTLGAYRGGCIRLWRGENDRPWSSIEHGETWLIGEGIEDCLTAVLEWPQWPTICAVSLYSMLSLELPQAVSDIVLLSQNDPVASPASQLLLRVIRRFQNMGKRVSRVSAPIYCKDINELAQRRQSMTPKMVAAEAGTVSTLAKRS